MSLVSLGLEGMCCFKLVLGIEGEQSLPAQAEAVLWLIRLVFSERGPDSSPLHGRQ